MYLRAFWTSGWLSRPGTCFGVFLGAGAGLLRSVGSRPWAGSRLHRWRALQRSWRRSVGRPFCSAAESARSSLTGRRLLRSGAWSARSGYGSSASFAIGKPLLSGGRSSVRNGVVGTIRPKCATSWAERTWPGTGPRLFWSQVTNPNPAYWRPTGDRQCFNRKSIILSKIVV